MQPLILKKRLSRKPDNTMKKFPFLILIVILLIGCTPKEENKSTIKPISDYFPKDKAHVLVVGTFHFDYPGLDAHQSAPENKIDVLKEPKKSEVTELVNYIKTFKPNKIAIEAKPGWGATEKLRKYKAGEFRNERDERFQLGMRIAEEIGLDTLYQLDAESMVDELTTLDSTYFTNLFKGFDFQNEDPYNEYYNNWFEEDDKLIPKVNLLEYFKYMNSKESHQYGYGAYLIGDFKLDDDRGADIISIWWYNRNMRIFRKLQHITEGPEDRILLIFGNGHAAVLRDLIEDSPEYEFVEFSSL